MPITTQHFRHVFSACLVGIMIIVALGASAQETTFDEDAVGGGSLKFIAQSEHFTYLGLNVLYELDRETGEALNYDEYNLPAIVGIQKDGSLMMLDNKNNFITTDLYRHVNYMPIADEDWLINMDLHDGILYFSTISGFVKCLDLETHETTTILDNTLTRFIDVDQDGLWYSTDKGLYLVSLDSCEVQTVIDKDVGYFQRIGDEIYYATSAGGGVIFAYSLKNQQTRQVVDKVLAYAFAFDRQGKKGAIITRPSSQLLWCDLETGENIEIGLPKDADPLDFQAMEGVLYLKVALPGQEKNGMDRLAIYQVNPGELNLIYEDPLQSQE